MSKDFDWTEQAIARLRTLWAGPDSTVTIGAKLGVSKNAVVGKVHRLGLPSRPSPIGPRAPGSVKIARRARRVAPAPKAALPPLAAPVPVSVKPVGPPVKALALSVKPVAAPSRPRAAIVRPEAPRAVEAPPLIVYAAGGRGCEAVLRPFKPGMDPRDVYCGKPRRDRSCSYCLVHAAVFLTRHVTRASTMTATLAAAE